MPLREVLLSHLALTIGQRLGPDGWITPSYHPLPPCALLMELQTRPEVRMLSAAVAMFLAVATSWRLDDPGPCTAHASPAWARPTMLASPGAVTLPVYKYMGNKWSQPVQ